MNEWPVEKLDYHLWGFWLLSIFGHFSKISIKPSWNIFFLGNGMRNSITLDYVPFKGQQPDKNSGFRQPSPGGDSRRIENQFIVVICEKLQISFWNYLTKIPGI
ncbi:hypothetical protein DERP_013572 [Dermatophagoides pteronyssinus]|uniref:Uncharacterized protein n=1 Tax=Dermatophagoides pteronyssinus TaxID=6956 RepID=A0ABQ8J5M0_DERPT|nr:hypothetical protein DERP_013572 [Dermatophagoides pteronyssinus]